MRKVILFCVLIVLGATVMPASADDQINYVSQPDSITVFLNGVAAVQDLLRVPGGADIQIVLPTQAFPDTLIVREDDTLLPFYSIDRSTGQVMLELPASGDESALRTISLQYLASGISWTPLYNMEFSESDAENVTMSFYAQIQNDAFTLDSVAMALAAGRVDTSQPIPDISTISANQYYAGYNNEDTGGNSIAATPVTIQYVYHMSDVNSAPGETLYAQQFSGGLNARRLLLWNASTDQQVTIIYKVKNDSFVPFAEGTVRSYQDGTFVGSDFIEFTPIGSEGSVTVGHVQDVRVNRAETVVYEEQALSDADNHHSVELTLSNFSPNDLTIDVVDTYPAESTAFTFSQEPEREAGNLLRWTVTIAAGETVTLTYDFRSPY